MVTHSARADDTTAKRVAVSHADRGIVVSGDPGSGKTTFVELLSAEYGKEVYSVGKYWREKYEKEHPSGDITFDEYWRSRPYRDQLEANTSLRHYAQDLGYIVDTRYASIFDKDRCLIIYLRAPLEVRAVRLATRAEYSGRTIKEIEAILAARQEDEVAIGKKLFGIDYRDRNFYDLILDSSLLTPDEELAAAKARMRKLMNLARR
jgi:cytidylate kinase